MGGCNPYPERSRAVDVLLPLIEMARNSPSDVAHSRGGIRDVTAYTLYLFAVPNPVTGYVMRYIHIVGVI